MVMTVKELIEELQKCTDKNTRVNIYDSGSEHIDITEIYVTERTSPLTGEKAQILIIY